MQEALHRPGKVPGELRVDNSSAATPRLFLHEVLERVNRDRQENLAAELCVIKLVPPTRISEWGEVWFGGEYRQHLRAKKVGYSVPARLVWQ
ncbi:MAG TPA: hypothetical protein VN673_16625 [Clostridia bacterium]|nr:hypothetical protein [Clostridia bacterium]